MAQHFGKYGQVAKLGPRQADIVAILCRHARPPVLGLLLLLVAAEVPRFVSGLE
jgi:hypothetical protein